MRVLLWVAAVMFAVGLGGAALIWSDYQAFETRALNVDQPASLVLPRGMSMERMVADLESRGLTEKALYWRVLGRLSGLDNQLKAGEYVINPGATPLEVLQLAAAGKVVQYELTIVEGWTYAELAEVIRENEILEQTTDLSDTRLVLDAISASELHIEGLFLPETYYFPSGTTDIEFLTRAYQGMQEVLQQQWDSRASELPYESPYEALIMASIIEKETGQKSERATIAGVFTRRLQRRMRLQTDPTVIYGMGANFDGNIRRADLRRDNPYNTYTRHGLPPTPIALPGEAAVHAALHPLAGDALYFVSRGDGSHKFSATLEEHNAAVIRYQLRGRN